MNEFILFAMSILTQTFLISYFMITSSEIVLEEKIPIKKRIILFDVLFIVITLSMLLRELMPINSILMYISILIIYILFLKAKKITSIILTTITAVVMMISEMGIFLIFLYVLGKPSQELISQSSLLLIISTVQVIILFLILLFIKKYYANKRNFTNTNTHNINLITNKKILYILVFVVIMILPSIILLAFNRYNFSFLFLLYNFIQLSTLFILSFVFIKKYIDNEVYKDSIRLLEINNKNLSSMVDGVRTVKHDLNNIFQAINGYVGLEDYDGLKKCLAAVTKECNILNSKSIVKSDIFDDPAIYGVVGSKHFVTSEKNILMELEVVSSFKDIDFPMTELSRIVGVLLDNAIEATENANEKFVKFEFRFDPKKNAHVLKIHNTYDIRIDIDLLKIYEKGYSTKKVKSGIGLWEVKKIIKRYKNSQIFASIRNEKFIQTIIIEKQ
ncbi:MAG: GHKL domain-containing protein [Clostridia bacterium]